MSSRPTLILAGSALCAFGLVACAQSHLVGSGETDPPDAGSSGRDADVPGRDADVFDVGAPPDPDGGTCVSATYRVTSGQSEDRVGVGTDLDDGGSEIGCGIDGPAGIDNGFALTTLHGRSQAAGFVIVPTVRVHVDACRPPESIVVDVGENSLDVLLSPEGRFQTPLPGTIRTSLGGLVSNTLEGATLSGAVQNGALTGLTLSGEFTSQAMERWLSRDDFASFLDLDRASDPGCESISAQLRLEVRIE